MTKTHHRLFLCVASIAVALGVVVETASAQLRVVSYNLAQLNGNTASIQDVIEEAHDDDSQTFAVPVAVFFFQEVRDDDVNFISAIVNGAAPAGTSYAVATYTNFGENGVAGAQMCMYNTNLLTEDVSEHADIATGAGRFADRWRFTIDGYDSPDASFYCYSAHLKAGSSTSDQDQRNAGATSLRNDIASLPSGTHVILAGDLNLSSPTEDAYQTLTAAGTSPRQLFDPLGGGSWSGGGNAWKHTQSPRDIQANGLIGGGLDDRFDFILANNDFNDFDGLATISGQYRSLGNDGNHYNDAINDGTNTYFPGETARSNALADDLFNASDHIPVIMDFTLPAVFGFEIVDSLPTVLVDAAVTVDFTVSNDAPGTHPSGADGLLYAVNLFGSANTTVNGSLGLGESDDHQVPVDTSSAGVLLVNVTLQTAGEAVQMGQDLFNLVGFALRHANGSFASRSDVDATTVTSSFGPDTGVQTILVPLYNHGYDAVQSMLDIDDVSGATGALSFEGADSPIGDTPGDLEFSFDTTGLAPGSYEQTLTVHGSDEDLAGELSQELSLTINVTIEGKGSCLGDLTGDNTVDVNDLLLLLANWGVDGEGADLAEPSDVVDVNDLLVVLGVWGGC